MRDLTLQDPTQRQILGELIVTEQLLAIAASKINGSPQSAEITALPDLGLPHNVRRILGGFFTGALYQWTGSAPLIPVDATVNVCGVGLYRLAHGFESKEHFAGAIRRAEAQLKDSSVEWNYQSGNHFISWVRARAGCGGPLVDGDYLVLHASPAEYKYQFNGLYPRPGNWFWDDLITIADESSPRPLRVLAAEKAERFYRWAALLEAVFHERQEFVAALIAGEQSIHTKLSVLHYGMPDSNSVAIGCQWLTTEHPEFLLLTEPRRPLVLLRAVTNGENVVNLAGSRRMLTPHGLGVTPRRGIEWSLRPDCLRIGGTALTVDDSLRRTPFIEIRPFTGQSSLDAIKRKCPCEVLGYLEPVESYYRGHTLTGKEL
jgi:hypothetical protein